MSYIEGFLLFFSHSIGAGIGGLSSIVSLLLTIFVLLSVSKIKNFYVFKTRVPELITNLESCSSELSTHIDTFDGMTTSIRKLLAKIEVYLITLRGKVGGDLKKQTKQLIKDIKQIEDDKSSLVRKFIHGIQRHSFNIDKEELMVRLEALHVDIYKLTASCEEKREDANWEK